MQQAVLDLNLSNPKKRGRPRREASPDQIRELRVQGLSFRAIARKTGLGYGTVRRAYWASQPCVSAAD
jgi:DNA invertase Pin-like site-specific DNA recombinase